MLGLGKPKQVDEFEAEGEIERVYHDLKQTLRVSGVNLIFRTWAGYEKFLPAAWDAMRASLETRAFEDAGDQVRAEAVRCAAALGRIAPASRAGLGESQLYQIRAALDLYHYINPKLLVLVSAARMALEGEGTGEGRGNAELIEGGVPPKMYPMEMVSDEPDDRRLKNLFEDIRKTHSAPSINSDYRTLALWPDYLESAWHDLKPIVQREAHAHAADELKDVARRSARSLSHPIRLTRGDVERLGENAGDIIKTTATFERLIAPLILNIALLGLEWKSEEELQRSPFPAGARQVKVRHGGAK